MWELSLTSFHLEGKVKCSPSPFLSSFLERERREQIYEQTGLGHCRVKKHQRQLHREEGRALPALTTQPVSRKSEVRASFSGRVPDLPEVIEHANLGAPSASLGWRTGLWAEAIVVHKGWEGVGLVRPARQRGWKRDPVRGGRGRKWGMLGLKEAYGGPIYPPQCSIAAGVIFFGQTAQQSSEHMGKKLDRR